MSAADEIVRRITQHTDASIMVRAMQLLDGQGQFRYWQCTADNLPEEGDVEGLVGQVARAAAGYWRTVDSPAYVELDRSIGLGYGTPNAVPYNVYRYVRAVCLGDAQAVTLTPDIAASIAALVEVPEQTAVLSSQQFGQLVEAVGLAAAEKVAALQFVTVATT